MLKVKGVLKGIFIGIGSSFFIPYFFSSASESLAGGRMSYWGQGWLYIAFGIPMILSMAIMGYYLSNRMKIENKKLWRISFFITLIVSLFTGTLGILISEMILRSNLNSLNVEGSIIWGIVYSIIFLPITVPLGKFIINSLHKWIHQNEVSINSKV